jgi:UDPglucose 6-dehydrogenase
MHESKKLLPNVKYCENAYEAMEGAEALALVTEWNEFRALDLDRVKSLLKQPVVVDLRNIYPPADMVAAGFKYICVGRPVPKTRQAAKVSAAE